LTNDRITGSGEPLEAAWSTRYAIDEDLESVMEIFSMDGTRVHSAADSASNTDHRKCKGKVIFNTNVIASLNPGNTYYIKWKTPDGSLFSGKTLAQSGYFRVTNLQSMLTDHKQAKLYASAKEDSWSWRQMELAAQSSKQPAKAAAASSNFALSHKRKASEETADSGRTAVLTREERKVFRKYFDAIDTANSDSLSAVELLAYMNSLGFDGLDPPGAAYKRP
jgi:hypothetical protein